MREITSEEIRKSVLENKIKIIDHHKCSICNYVDYYSVVDEKLFHTKSCHCSIERPREIDWEDLAILINIQPNQDTKIKIMKKLFLDPKDFCK